MPARMYKLVLKEQLQKKCQHADMPSDLDEIETLWEVKLGIPGIRRAVSDDF